MTWNLALKGDTLLSAVIQEEGGGTCDPSSGPVTTLPSHGQLSPSVPERSTRAGHSAAFALGANTRGLATGGPVSFLVDARNCLQFPGIVY